MRSILRTLWNETAVIDRVEFEVIAGNGGDGVVSFRREKFVPRGGPDGGDGGRGGDVVLVADVRLSTLRGLQDGRPQRAQDGRAGGTARRRGRSAPDLELRVPAGCVVWELGDGGEPRGEPLADLEEPGARAVVARGGRGGWGNQRFASATRQAPRFAQSGAPGERRRLLLELRLLADVGIVGLPNAGKSTLLRAWSAATPKVAAYPFTTLEPQLGVVEAGGDSFVAADLPGLIEGASEGHGLGHEFLRHIERTRVLVHVIDAAAPSALDAFDLVNGELAAFRPERPLAAPLEERPQLVALNKIDVPAAGESLAALGALLSDRGVPWLEVSALSRGGTRELALRAAQLLGEVREAAAAAASGRLPVLRPPPRRRRFEVSRGQDGVAEVAGNTPEWLAATLDTGDEEARGELFRRLQVMGIARALERVGVERGDRVRIGSVEIVWEG